MMEIAIQIDFDLDDEDRAREARKRRNYDLLLQRRTTRGSAY